LLIGRRPQFGRSGKELSKSHSPLSFALLSAVLLSFVLNGAITAANTSAVYGASINVQVYVDEEEPATAAQWKARLGKRLQRASDVFDRYGILRFRVVSYGRWKSDNREQDLSRSLSEFEQQVQPNRGAIAIGFTSQYRFSPGRHQLGGTRGPLHSHILIRENNPRAVEMERLELLVHEIGHFLGAVHTDQVGSVMRPVLTSRQPRDRLKIEFDPENARIIRLFGEEVSNLKVRRASQLTDDTKEKLRQVYRQIQQRMPNDPTVEFYLNLIE